MNTLRLHRWISLGLLFGATALVAAAAGREIVPLDADWRFHRGEASGPEQGAFADAAWTRVDVPHDWSIAGPFAETNPAGGAGAFLPSGVAWYRKHFTLPPADAARVVTVEFDGVMANSEVWINGHRLGHRPNGYVSFQYDLTGRLNPAGDNVLVVRADTAAQPASRWYAGAGIYRHVRLVVTDPVHFAADGIFVSTPQVSAESATVKIEASLANASAAPRTVTVQLELVGPDGGSVAAVQIEAKVAAAGSALVAPSIVIPRPQRWDLDRPALYRLVSQVREAGRVVDEVSTPFGIRDAHFEAATGFWLNGKNFKLNGVCLHADGGAFGAAVPLEVWADRLRMLRTLGVNAIRTAHNPAAPEFLDLCDRLGFLVMDEFFDCWTVAKNPADYHLYFEEWSQIDERATIRRDRNHPSVILYSVGNEIHDTPQAEKAKRILRGLVEVAHATDPTRPVTQALFRPNVSHDYDDGLADLLDVVGQNYRPNEIIAAHEQNPARKIVGTENTHARDQWIAVRDHAAYAGEFLWTGIDYLGESRRWPVVGHGSGLLDRTGAVRPLARERQSWWTEAPMVAIARRVAPTELMPTDPGYGKEERHTQVLFGDWTPRQLSPHDETVEIYSNAPDVELFLNGRSLGVESIRADASPRVWRVAFVPGVIRAVARHGGRAVAVAELRTAGPAARIELKTEHRQLAPGWDHVAVVRATIVDAQGVSVPGASDLLAFKVTGPGVVAAVDNGDNRSQEAFQASERSAYQGETVAYLRATATSGTIVVTAVAAGLEPGTISLQAASAPAR